MRANEKIADDRERLVKIEPGGSPARPIELMSASLVEVHAKSMPCARCGAELRVKDHTAEKIDGELLRIVHASCFMCGTKRRIYFRIAPAMAN
jgi:hypothetical protein